MRRPPTPARYRRTARAGRADEQGAVIVEFAAVFILFATLLAGLVTFGMSFAVKQSVEHATSEAARSVVGMTDQGEAQAVILEVVDDQLGWLGGTGSPDVSVGTAWNSPCGGCVTVTTTYDGGLLSLMPFRFAAPSQVGATATLRHDVEDGA